MQAADVGVFIVNADGNPLDTSTTRLTRLSRLDSIPIGAARPRHP
jgi:hypothetical protein